MKERSGFDWKETSTGGYWVKQREGHHHKHTLPFFCPREECKKITSTIDDKYLLEYGVCSQCYVFYIEDRNAPIIDVEFFKNRLKQRGY